MSVTIASHALVVLGRVTDVTFSNSFICASVEALFLASRVFLLIVAVVPCQTHQKLIFKK